MCFTIPLFFASFFSYILNILNIRKYYHECVFQLDKCTSSAPEVLIELLTIAEDIRFRSHYGVDPIGIARAIVAMIKGNIQGASTIEQQLVRTVIGRYERTLLRKVREQMIANLISLKYCKRDIANTYLNIAYYGYELIGYKSLVLKYKKSDLEFLATVVARLKYPEPKIHSGTWEHKINKRRKIILDTYLILNNESKINNSIKEVNNIPE